MATRVTDAEVKAVVDTQRDTTPFITTANLLVEEELLGEGYTAARLKQIELYLAAHFVAVTEERGGVAFQKMGDSSEQVKGLFTQGLNLTRYGQHALALDKSGVLDGVMNSTRKAKFRVV